MLILQLEPNASEGSHHVPTCFHKPHANPTRDALHSLTHCTESRQWQLPLMKTGFGLQKHGCSQINGLLSVSWYTHRSGARYK